MYRRGWWGPQRRDSYDKDVAITCGKCGKTQYCGERSRMYNEKLCSDCYTAKYNMRIWRKQ